MRSVEAQPVETARCNDVLGEVADALDAVGISYLFAGRVAVSSLARSHPLGELTVLVRPGDARTALQALAEVGFDTEPTDPLRLFTATKGGVPVKVLFSSERGLELDEEMLARGVDTTLAGRPVRVLPAEDLLLAKIAGHDESTAHDWFDALEILRSRELDWGYLLLRSRRAVRRVLSLLVYADSADVAVPAWVIRTLTERVYLATTPPSPHRSAEHAPTPPSEESELRRRLRTDPRVGDHDIEVLDVGDSILLTGAVPSTEQKRAVVQVASELAPGRRIDDRTVVAQRIAPLEVLQTEH